MLILEQSPKIIGKSFHSASWPFLDKLMIRLVSSACKQLGKWEGDHPGNSSLLGYCNAWNGVDLQS